MKLLIAALAAPYVGAAIGFALHRRNERAIAPKFVSNVLEAGSDVHYRAERVPAEHAAPEMIANAISDHIASITAYSEAEGIAFDWATLRVDTSASYDMFDPTTEVVDVVTTVRAYPIENTIEVLVS